MKIRNVVAGAAMVSLLFFAQANGANAADIREILTDKIPLAQGWCHFKDGKFLRFLTGFYRPPRGDFSGRVSYKNCLLLVKSDRSMNPAWLLILDKAGKAREIIEWTDKTPSGPAEFKKIWQDGIEI